MLKRGLMVYNDNGDNMDTILSVENLVKYYVGNQVLKNVSFSLERGKIYGLLGPNGAGKTTIMKILTDTIKKNGGEINYSDDLKIKYLMDVPTFYEYMRVEEYLNFLADIAKVEDKEKRVSEILTITNLEAHKQKKIKQLSRGLRQKLGIAALLVDDVDLLILDEPISALDPIGRKEVLELIVKLKGRVCVIFSSHILVDIEEVCDHILLLNEGVLLVNDSYENLLKQGDKLRIKCKNQEELQKLQEIYADSKIIGKDLTQLELSYDDLITKQLEVLRYAKKHQITIEKMEVSKTTLEEIFLNEVNNHE
jgi:ABC-2 type transport system ATP-binding protein